MGLNIIVCIKQVSDPDYFSELTLDPETGNIQRENVPAILNSFDEHALEEALRIKDEYSAKITVVSMGPPQATEILEWALALGADKAVLLSDRAFAGADSLATAYCLAEYIENENYDLIFCGNQTDDGATAQVGPQIAELLNIPHVTYVSKVNKINLDNKSIITKRDIEYGGYLEIKAKLPALVAVLKNINEVRDVTAEGMMTMGEKEFKTLSADDIDAEETTIGLKGSPTRVVDTYEQSYEREKEIFKGSSQEIAKKVKNKLLQKGIL